MNADVFFSILQFCPVETVLSLSLVCQDYRRWSFQDRVWKMLGKRDWPNLSITCHSEYPQNPELVLESDLQKYLDTDNFCRDWLRKRYMNKNSVLDHTIPALVRSIALDCIRVDQYRLFRKNIGDTYWRIAIDIRIHDLDEESEKDYKILEKNEKYFKMLS